MKYLIVILIASIVSLSACRTSKFESGTYRVSTVKHVNGNSIVKFEGYEREFILPTDTLKKGDLVYFVDPELRTFENSTVSTD